MIKQLRAVVGAPVSVMKGEDKVSHLAQQDAGVRWAERNDAKVVGTFQDLDVSADKVPPFERPDLKPWLAEDRQQAWDIMIFSKIDRAFRSTYDCVQFAKWCEERKKILVFAEDGLVLNYLNPAGDLERMMAEFFVYVGSFFAQIELNRFRTRAQDAHRILRPLDRWAGGCPPEGFVSAPHPSGKGRTLVHEPSRQKMLHECGRLLLDEGQSLNGIAKWLEQSGYETTLDFHRAPDDKRGTRWSAAQVIGMLTSLSTQGIKMHGAGKNSRPVLDHDGNVVRLGPATFDDATWNRIQVAVKQRRYGAKKRVNGASPLGGVVHCGLCRAKARHRVTHHAYATYRYYNCGNLIGRCSGVNSNAEEVEAFLEQTFLEECGSERVRQKVFVPGEDHTEELERVKRIIAGLREDRELGLIVGAEDEATFRRQMAALLSQRSHLESKPQREPGWRVEEGEQTYGDVWAESDQEGRRRLLLDAGVRFWLHGRNNWEVDIPDDIRSRLTARAAS